MDEAVLVQWGMAAVTSESKIETEITIVATRHAIMSDGARVRWEREMDCNCAWAMRQPTTKKMCKHIAEVIRRSVDSLPVNYQLPLPILLPANGEEKPSWVVCNIGTATTTSGSSLRYAGLEAYHHAEFLSEENNSPVAMSRLTARELIIPHLFGEAHKIKCYKCVNDRPVALVEFLTYSKSRLDVSNKRNVLQEICHSIETGNTFCIAHDDNDLIPVF